MADPIITTASFCSGVGWLDEGLRAGCNYFGIRAEPALLCEWEAYAAAVLLARMEDASMEQAPIWGGDMRDFDGRPFRGLVDIAAAGLPRQPYSTAGKQLGNEDHRSFGDGDGPLPQFLRIVSEIRPAVVFLENVPAWVCGGWFRSFGEELCGLGYKIEEPVFVTAESVGASHKRERVFVLAHDPQSRSRLLSKSNGWHDPTDSERSGGSVANSIRSKRQSRPGRERIFNDGPAVGEPDGKPSDVHGRECTGLSMPAGNGATVGNASGAREGSRPARSGSRDSVGESGGLMGNSKGRRSKGGSLRSGNESQQPAPDCRGGDVANAEPAERWREDSRWGPEQGIASGGTGTELFAPGPQCEQWGTIIADSPHLAPAIEPGFRVLADGVAYVVDESRTNQLRCTGNGCVALQAAVAFIELVRRLT